MKFGVPSQRMTKKEELFPNKPVLTLGIDGGKGTSKGMFLNSSAVELLGLGENATIAFAFEDGLFVTNGDNPAIPDEHKIRVTKGDPRKVSEKRTYEYISKRMFDLDNSVENHFEFTLVPVEEGGVKVYQLTLMTDETVEDTTSKDEPIAVEEFRVDTEEVETEQFS